MLNLAEFDNLIGQDSYVLCQGKERKAKDIVDRDTAIRWLERPGNTVGWWVTQGYVVVDVDEGKDEAKAMLRKLKINTLVCETNKGLHIYFKTDKPMKQKVGMTLPSGLKCDVRCAGKGYVMLPYEMDGRKFFGSKTIADLPLELTPIEWKKDSLLGLKEGDSPGRNTGMFAQLIAYKNMGATQDQIDQMGEIINYTIFEQSMEATELGKILKNVEKYEATQQNPFLFYSDKGKPLSVNEPAIVDHLLQRGEMYVLGNSCYVYQEGIYKEASKQVRQEIKKLIDYQRFITDFKVRSIYRLLVDIPELEMDSELLNPNKHLINFKNGVWNLETQELLPHDPKYLQTIQIPYEVVQSPVDWEETRLYKFLKKKCRLSDEDVDMIADFIAFCLTLKRWKGFMVLTGPSNTGKSVLITFIERLVGNKNNVSSLAMSDFKDKFRVSQLYNSVLNTSADDSSKALSDISTIKKITGGDSVTHEMKGKDPFPFKSFAKLIFSFNQLPLQLEEKSDAYYERMRVLEMTKVLDLDSDYVDDLWSERSIKEVLPHLLDRLPLGDIESTKRSNELVESLRQDSDSIHAFISKCCNKAPDLKIKKTLAYEKYAVFCKRELGVEPYIKRDFYRHFPFPARKISDMYFIGVDLKRGQLK